MQLNKGGYQLNYLRIILFSVFFIFCYFGHSQTSGGDGTWKTIDWGLGGNPPDFPYYPNSATIGSSVIIPEGELIEIDNLIIEGSGKLNVKGNLIVHGAVEMMNDAVFDMDSTAVVVVKGNFSSGNKLTISVSSLLIVQGNFTTKGAVKHTDLDITQGNVYIFGEVDGDWGIDDCDPNNGSGDGSGGCEYGTEEEFIEDDPQLPPDLIDLINCVNLEIVSTSDPDICPGQTAYFRVNMYTDVTYVWQVNKNNTGWEDVNGDENELTIPNTTLEMESYKYRVIASSSNDQSTCKISVSEAVSISFNKSITWTGAESADWNDTRNWSCNSIPTSGSNVTIPVVSTNYPMIDVNQYGLAQNLNVVSGAQITVKGYLQVSGNILSQEGISAQDGTLILNGNISQTISAGSFTDYQIKDLRINNISGVQLQEALNLTGILTMEEGNLLIRDQMRLFSDVDRTALISGQGTGQVEGKVIMERYIDPAFGYKYISSPFSNSTLGDLAPSIPLEDPDTNFPHFYRYNENREKDGNDLTGWEAYTDPTNPLNVMEGYALNFEENSTPVTLSLSGEVNNDTLKMELYTTHGTYTRGFHLVGNPYPSPIDWDSNEGWIQKLNIDNGIYFFNASSDNQYTGTYTSYVNGISSAGNSSNIIPSMQGFFVHVADGASLGVLEINNDARIDDFTQQFHKSSDKEKDLLRIYASFENSEHRDHTVIYSSPLATASFDPQLDAFKMMNTHEEVPNLYSVTPEKKELSINAFPIFTDNALIRIPLGIKAERSGNMTIGRNNKTKFSSSHYLYLIDLENQTSVNLNDRTYTFFLKKGTHNSRFELLFSKEPITEKAVLLNEPFSVSAINGLLKIKLNLAQEQEGLLHISTISGQTIRLEKAVGKAEIEIAGIKSSGVYIVSLQNGKSHFSKKIILQE